MEISVFQYYIGQALQAEIAKRPALLLNPDEVKSLAEQAVRVARAAQEAERDSYLAETFTLD